MVNLKNIMGIGLKSAPFLLVLITIVAFSPTFFNDFQTGWDDTWQVLEHYYVVNFSFENTIYHFTEFYEGQYSPVNTVFYIFLHETFGFNAMAFHTACLIVHILNVLLVYVILKDIVKTVKPEFKPGRIKLYAALASLIFAIHPLQVESVAWISASKIVLYAFFMLMALWCYIKFIHSQKVIWLFAVAILYALSFGSKEQAIIFPLNLLIFDYLYKRFRGVKLSKIMLKSKVLYEKLPFFGMAFGFWYFSSLFNLGGFIKPDTYPLYQRLVFGAHSMMEYIFRALAPVKLYYFYYFPIKVGERLPIYFWVYAILVFIIIGFVWNQYKKNNRLVVFAFLFFMVNLLLVLHIVPMPRKMITADRYMYISIIGIALVAIWFVDVVLTKFKAYKKTVVTILGLYIAFLGAHTFYRTQDWKNSDTMKHNVNEIIERRKALKQPPVTNNPLIKSNDEN